MTRKAVARPLAVEAGATAPDVIEAKAKTRPNDTADAAELHIPQLMSLGERIALARRNKGWTQQDLSDRVGKSRATVVQYEQGRLQPPVQQIDVLAKVLEVSPEYIAFGRQGIVGLEGDSATVTAVPEIEFNEEEEKVIGAYGLPDSLINHLGLDPVGSRVVILTQAALHFNYAVGDRLIISPDAELAHEHGVYALRTWRGVEVVRLLPSLSARQEVVNLNDASGQSHSYERKDLNVLGRVMGTIRAGP
jgi:transcriptional regulator with XRE-family HTH domain